MAAANDENTYVANVAGVVYMKLWQFCELHVYTKKALRPRCG